MLDWQRPQVRPWLRAIALFTVITFTVTNVVWADGIQTLRSGNSSNVPLPSATASKNVLQSHLLDDIKFPDSIGQIKTTFKGNRDRIVIHIQDAHANEEAQRNIAKILDYFAGQQLMRLVTLEGAEGDLFTSLFSMFPNKVARKNIADYFLKEARLTGPEYLAIVDRPEMKLYGVEDRTIYEENRKAYVEALDYQPQDEKVLEDIGKVMDGVSRYVFSEDLRELIKRRSTFHEGGRELVK